MAKSREQKRLERKQQKAKVRALQYAASAERKRLKGFKIKIEHKVKINGYSFNKRRTQLNKKRLDAECRQAIYQDLTKNEKLALIKNRRGNSKKELDKVLKLK